MCVSIGYFTICGKITKNRAQRKKKSFFFMPRWSKFFFKNMKNRVQRKFPQGVSPQIFFKKKLQRGRPSSLFTRPPYLLERRERAAKIKARAVESLVKMID